MGELFFHFFCSIVKEKSIFEKGRIILKICPKNLNRNKKSYPDYKTKITCKSITLGGGGELFPVYTFSRII
jgi:hypothetical protein